MPKHPHAELMMQYAQDAMETDEPWKRWEIEESNLEWCDLKGPIQWYPDVNYRRKPKTININGHEVPEPLRVEPAIGTPVYMVFPNHPDFFIAEAWLGASFFNNQCLKRGFLHLTKEAAQVHAKALLSFTEQK